MKKLLINTVAFGEGSQVHMSPSLDTGDEVIKFTVEVIDMSRPTRNGVLYPVEEFKKALERPMLQDLLRRGAFYGEDDHPTTPSGDDDEAMGRWMKIDMSKMTHKFTKLWMEGNKLMGECQTFSGNGNLMYHAIKSGELLAFSIRVVGNPKPKGEYVQLEDIHLLAIDWVRYPGNPTSHIHSMDEYKVSRAPLFAKAENGHALGLSRRMVAKAEGYESIFGMNSNNELIALGEGYYEVVEKLSDNYINKIWENRLNSF